jgi:hypothetical protein
VEGFLPVPGRVFLPDSPPYRDRTHPPYHHPHPHNISPKSRLFPQITPHIKQQNPISGANLSAARVISRENHSAAPFTRRIPGVKGPDQG